MLSLGSGAYVYGKCGLHGRRRSSRHVRGRRVDPYRVDAVGISLAQRARLYWCTWELLEEGCILAPPTFDGWYKVQTVSLTAAVDPKNFLEPGWHLPPVHTLATFTTSRPSNVPGRRPAGLQGCDEATRQRWQQDWHRFPPYQYKHEFCVHHHVHGVRVASVLEREVIMGFPAHYTQQCVPGTPDWRGSSPAGFDERGGPPSCKHLRISLLSIMVFAQVSRLVCGSGRKLRDGSGKALLNILIAWNYVLRSPRFVGWFRSRNAGIFSSGALD